MTCVSRTRLVLRSIFRFGAIGWIAVLSVAGCSDTGDSSRALPSPAVDATSDDTTSEDTTFKSAPSVGDNGESPDVSDIGSIDTAASSSASNETVAASVPRVDPLPALVTAPAEISAGCLDERWYVTDSTGGAQAVRDIVGVTLSISKLQWAMSASNASATLGGTAVTFDGTASGAVDLDGDSLELRPGNAVGDVAGPITFEALASLLVPQAGAGNRTCEGSSAVVTDGTTTVVLDRRPPVPPESVGLQAVEITDSGGSDDIECHGRSFLMTGSDNSYTFFGSCPKISVSGDGNSIAIEYVDGITVTGSHNTIVYRAGLTADRAVIDDSGTGNTIELE